jgi:hypothetical protein
MYIEGLQQEKILTTGEGETPQPQKPEFGKPIDLGPQAVDLDRVGQRTIELKSVNWGPPEV